MKKSLNALALVAIALSVSAHAWATQKDTNPGGDRITFDSDHEDFNDLFPVTEKLNQILAQITKTEVENGREIPNFIVYPYDAEDAHAEPFTLVWDKGQYSKRTQLPANAEAILIYDPRRISAGAEEIEEGQRVLYQHFVVRYNFNDSAGIDDAESDPASRLEPTDNSIYISRAILKGEDPSRAGAPTVQKICFPRIAVPEKFNGEDVRTISLQFGSALPAAEESAIESESAEEHEAPEDSEKSIFLVD